LKDGSAKIAFHPGGFARNRGETMDRDKAGALLGGKGPLRVTAIDIKRWERRIKDDAITGLKNYKSLNATKRGRTPLKRA